MKLPLLSRIRLMHSTARCVVTCMVGSLGASVAGSVCVESAVVAVDTRAFGSCIESSVVAIDTRTEYDLWAEGEGLSGTFANPNGRPFGDSVDNLFKWAFDLPGDHLSSGIVTNGTTHGLPLVVAVNRSGSYVLQATLVQRTQMAGLVYEPLLSNDLATWYASMVPVSRITLEPGWESVVYEAPATMGSRQFCKIMVTYLPP